MKDMPGAAGAWADLDRPGHTVEFYRSDEDLLNGLRGFIGPALLAGGAGVIIATPEHLLALASKLQDSGIDLNAATKHGRYVALDAAETLQNFMVGASPDPARFF